MLTKTRTPLTTERPQRGSPREITERIPVRSFRGIRSDPSTFDPLGHLADVDLIFRGRVSLHRIVLSVISVLSVVQGSSRLPESTPSLSAQARPQSWQAGAVQFTAEICRLVGRTTLADLPCAGRAFSPESGRWKKFHGNRDQTPTTASS